MKKVLLIAIGVICAFPVQSYADILAQQPNFSTLSSHRMANDGGGISLTTLYDGTQSYCLPAATTTISYTSSIGRLYARFYTDFPFSTTEPRLSATVIPYFTSNCTGSGDGVYTSGDAHVTDVSHQLIAWSFNAEASTTLAFVYGSYGIRITTQYVDTGHNYYYMSDATASSTPYMFITDNINDVDIMNPTVDFTAFDTTVCDIGFDFRFSGCFGLMFGWNQTVMAARFTELHTTLLEFWPLGYVTRLVTIVTGTGTSTFPSLVLTLPSTIGSSDTSAFHASTTIDVQGAINTASDFLNTPIETEAGTFRPFSPLLILWTLFCYLALFFKIIMEIIHPFGGSKEKDV
jgi:hypothetical protein